MARRSPPPGLHHRNPIQSNPTPYNPTKPILTSPSKLLHHQIRSFKRPQPFIHRVRYLLTRCLIPTTFIIGLVFYFVVISYKQWPPNGQTLNSRDLIDQFQGEWWVSPNVTRAQRFLLVVAHPDDECLFFSPTLLNLLLPRYVNLTELEPVSLPNSTQIDQPTPSSSRAGNINSTLLSRPTGHILSLSSGNADGLGKKRAREMRASCWAFGITSERCIVLDHPELQDSMSVWWPEHKISELVKIYVELWKIDLVITFDHHGVSGHANHRAIAAAISRMVHTDRTFPMTMMLESSSLLSKYISLFSLPLSLYNHHLIRKSLLPTFHRPHSHPSRDRQRLNQLVQTTLSSVNYSINLPLDPFTPSNLSMITLTNNNETDDQTFRITDSNLSTHHTLLLSSPGQYYEGRRAFNQHVTQNVWFRRLWLIFSRYMWINELRRVVPLEDRFEPDLPPLTTSSTS